MNVLQGRPALHRPSLETAEALAGAGLHPSVYVDAQVVQGGSLVDGSLFDPLAADASLAAHARGEGR
jgi:hypothetical protein